MFGYECELTRAPTYASRDTLEGLWRFRLKLERSVENLDNSGQIWNILNILKVNMEAKFLQSAGLVKIHRLGCKCTYSSFDERNWCQGRFLYLYFWLIWWKKSEEWEKGRYFPQIFHCPPPSAAGQAGREAGRQTEGRRGKRKYWETLLSQKFQSAPSPIDPVNISVFFAGTFLFALVFR